MSKFYIFTICNHLDESYISFIFYNGRIYDYGIGEIGDEDAIINCLRAYIAGFADGRGLNQKNIQILKHSNNDSSLDVENMPEEDMKKYAFGILKEKGLA